MRAKGPVIAWLLAGAVALAAGVAYATGFVATASTAVDASHGEATPLLGQPPGPEAPLYPGAVTTTNLTIGFDGLWGQIAHDTEVFGVSIPADDARTGQPYPAGATFAVNVFATNQPDVVNGAGGHTPWSTLTLQWTVAPCPGGVFADETAPNPTFATPTAQGVMAVTGGTIHVALTGLAPATLYCVGVKQAYPDANDPAGTYLARPYAADADATAANPGWTSAVPVAPLFTALIQRLS
jgi:hypothetical protein